MDQSLAGQQHIGRRANRTQNYADSPAFPEPWFHVEYFTLHFGKQIIDLGQQPRDFCVLLTTQVEWDTVDWQWRQDSGQVCQCVFRRW